MGARFNTFKSIFRGKDKSIPGEWDKVVSHSEEANLRGKALFYSLNKSALKDTFNKFTEGRWGRGLLQIVPALLYDVVTKPIELLSIAATYLIDIPAYFVKQCANMAIKAVCYTPSLVVAGAIDVLATSVKSPTYEPLSQVVWSRDALFHKNQTNITLWSAVQSAKNALYEPVEEVDSIPKKILMGILGFIGTFTDTLALAGYGATKLLDGVYVAAETGIEAPAAIATKLDRKAGASVVKVQEHLAEPPYSPEIEKHVPEKLKEAAKKASKFVERIKAKAGKNAADLAQDGPKNNHPEYDYDDCEAPGPHSKKEAKRRSEQSGNDLEV